MSIAFQITIQGKEISQAYDIDVVSRVKRDFVYYRQEVKNNEIQLAYLETKRILSEEALSINSYLDLINEPFDSTVYMSTNSKIISEKNNLIFTTVTSSDATGAKALFFGHKFVNKVSNVKFIPWKTNISNQWVYSEKYNAVFSDLENDLEVETKRYNANYVQFTSLASNSYYESGKTYSEIYRREPIFREQTAFDFSIETLMLEPGAPTYTKKQLPDGKWEYIINKSPNEVVYYTEYSERKTSVQVSPGLTLDYAWPIEIIGTGVTVKNSETQQSLVYNWQDKSADKWFPYYPFSTLKKDGFYINSTSFGLVNSHITLKPEENIHLTYKVYRKKQDQSYVLLFAESTDPFYINKKIAGTYIDDNIVRYSKFTGNVDYSLGVVTINNQVPLQETDKIVAEYVIKEEENQKNIYNANPLFNKKVLDGFVMLFVTPKTEEQDSVIHWLWAKERVGGYYIYESSYDDTEIVGLSLDQFKNLCAFNFITNVLPSSFPEEALLPICSISFRKDKYIENISHKDLRVFAGIKDDYAIESRNKVATFSNLLNPSGTINVDPRNQVFVFIDKDQSQYPTPVDEINFKAIINQNLPANLIGHQRYIEYQTISNLVITRKILEGNDSLVLNFQASFLGNNLRIYLLKNNKFDIQNDIILADINKSEGTTQDENIDIVYGTFRFEKIINISTLDLSSDIGNIVYLSFECGNISEDIPNIFTPVSGKAKISQYYIRQV